jgi:hypothetical protein
MVKIDKQLKDSFKLGPQRIIDLIIPMQEKYDKYWEKIEEFAAISLVSLRKKLTCILQMRGNIACHFAFVKCD